MGSARGKKKILVCRFGAFGDVCMAIPLVSELAKLHDVHWLIRDTHAPLVGFFPELSSVRLVRVNPGHFRWFSSRELAWLHAQNYDVFLDLNRRREVTWLSRHLSSIPERVTYREQGRDASGLPDPEAFSRVVCVSAESHQVEKWRCLIGQVLGVDLALTWPLPNKRLGSSRIVLVQPHSRVASKRWPLKRFEQALLQGMSNAGTEIWINMGTRREWLRSWVLGWRLRLKGARVRWVPLDRSYGKLKAALEAADCVLGTDSGPMHFAALVGTPTVVVGGQSPLSEFHPLWRTHSVPSSSPGAWARETGVDRVVPALKEVLQATLSPQV